jgi:CheY-like chemotaxis protein
MRRVRHSIVLIVEDDPFIGIDLKDLVESVLQSQPVLRTGQVEAVAALIEPINFAILDVNVSDGDTFDLARRLVAKQIPFVFVSGSLREHIPADLRDAPFLAKPFREGDLLQIARSLDPWFSEPAVA